MNQEPFVIERTYSAPVDRVWRAITDPQQMKQWYFDIPAFEPVAGNQFSFTGTDHDGKEWVHLCRVTEVVPNKRIAYTWAYEGFDGESLVVWELFPDGTGTRLKLTHSGLETFPPMKSLAKENFVAGWTEILGSLLPKHLETVSTESTFR